MSRIVIKSILISEAVDPCCREVLQENGIRVTEKLNLSREDLISEIKVTMMNTLLLSAAHPENHTYSSYLAAA